VPHAVRRVREPRRARGRHRVLGWLRGHRPGRHGLRPRGRMERGAPRRRPRPRARGPGARAQPAAPRRAAGPRLSRPRRAHGPAGGGVIGTERSAVRMAPGDLSPLRIDEALVRTMLVAFLRDETLKTGAKRLVLGVSGGVDSAVVAALAAEALGPANVLGLFTPYRSIGSRSREHAEDVARVFGIRLEEVPITGQVDAYFPNEPKAHRVRVGNKMARERKSIEYDRSWPDGLVLGTSNKTELLLGYGTQFGDMACALNP